MTTHELADSIARDHMFLCHSDGSQCEDGCDVTADPKQLERYQEPMKSIHQSAIETSRELIEAFKLLPSCSEDVKRYQKVVKFSLKRLFGRAHS